MMRSERFTAAPVASRAGAATASAAEAPAGSLPAGRGAPSVDIAHVLDVSVRLFAEQGFDGVSMRDISRECGYPTPSIYYHFASKGELYQEAYANKIEQTIDWVTARVDAEPVVARRFTVLIGTLHDLFLGDRNLLLLMQRDVVDVTAGSRSFRSQRQYRYFSGLIARVGSAAAGRPIGDDEAFTVGALIFGYCELSTALHEVYDQHGEQVLQTERERLVKAALALLAIPN